MSKLTGEMKSRVAILNKEQKAIREVEKNITTLLQTTLTLLIKLILVPFSIRTMANPL